MKLLSWVCGLLGSALFVFGLFGLSDTDKHLRKEADLQEAIIRHYRLGHSAEVRAEAEERLERHRTAKHLHVDSVVLNVFGVLIGIGLLCIPVRSVAGRKKEA